MRLLNTLFGTKTGTTRRASLHLDTLSARDLPSVTLLDGVISVTGDASNDVVTVTRGSGRTSSVYDDTVTVQRAYGTQSNPLSEAKTFYLYRNSVGSHFPTVRKVVADLKDGANKFTNSTALASEATGGKDADTFEGGSGRDRFDGKGGADKLFGNAGDDALYGGPGDDYLDGGYGNDGLYAGAGEDTLFGRAGRDTLVAVDGSGDLLYGGSEVDTFWADQQTDGINDLASAEVSGRRAHWIAAYSDLAQMVTGQQGDVTWADVFYTPVGKALNGPNLLDPVPAPNDTHVANFKDRPLFGPSGPRLDDIDQNRVPDCWLMSALGAVAAKDPEVSRQAVTELGDGTYAVRFYRNGHPVYYRVDADLITTDSTNTALRYAGFGQDGSVWVAVIEKAYAFYRRDDGSHTATVSDANYQVGWYQSVGYGDPADAGRALGRWAFTTQTDSFATKSAYLTVLKARIAAGYAVVIDGPAEASDWTASRAERSNAHAWTVVGYAYNSSGQATGLKIRNPYKGPDGWSSEAPYQTVSFDAAYASSWQFSTILA